MARKSLGVERLAAVRIDLSFSLDSPYHSHLMKERTEGKPVQGLELIMGAKNESRVCTQAVCPPCAGPGWPGGSV